MKRPLLLGLSMLSSCAAAETVLLRPAQEALHVRLLVQSQVQPFDDAAVVSVDDSNRRFQVTLAGPAGRVGDTEQPRLECGGLQLVASSWGRNGDRRQCLFDVARPQALTLAAALGVSAVDRPSWRVALSATVAAAERWRAGAERLPLSFTLQNSGPVAVWFHDGGRSRNELGRDNRFEFEVTLDGARLPLRALHDFGGFGVYRRLEPGNTHTLELDLAHWCRLERPGAYRLEARYSAELMPAEYEPSGTLALGQYAHLQRAAIVIATATIAVE